ncbi:hypothetical protein [Acidithiobacillus sp.]|uniref:hypothetical protein n=1 Tax=Acidithiobacillus sp. TaxID=1872118 RepID=UPI0026113ECA|nr:hypothetical protein [Acidithiobacillus sp.]MDD5280833.1 hypothetical protein [Acidithiobacillus sp.]
MSTGHSTEATEAQEVTPPATEGADEKKGFLQRYAYPVMIVLGVLCAGGASYLIQDWGNIFGHNSAVSAGPGPKNVKVVYIDSGKIMSDVIQQITAGAGTLSHRQAAAVGTAVGQTIQDVARVYAAKGDLVLSQNVLAAPASNNLTAMTEAEVMGRVNAILAGKGHA